MRSGNALIGLPPAKEIVSEDAALRGMRDSDIRPDGRIRKSAFKPRSNGQDRDGLSVSISDPAYVGRHRAKYDQPGKATASIVVKEVWKIGLNVIADPDETDPRHALIAGIPDLTLGELEKREAERLAQLLADHANVHMFPPADS